MTTPTALRLPKEERICTYPGCDRPWSTRKLCKMHYMDMYNRLNAYGRWESSYVDAQPIREHILALRQGGISNKRLRQLAGVSNTSIQNIITGRRERGTGPAKHVTATVAAKILAVPIPASPHDPAIAQGRRVCGVGTARRLQALVALGWTQTELGARIGVGAPNMKPLMCSTQVLASTACKVAALYDELSMTPGPSVRARNDAARKGWHKPLEWDDDTIDDPAAKPASAPCTRRVDQRMAEWEWLIRGGVHPQTAAHRLGVTYDAVTQWYVRAGQTPPVCRNGHKMIRPRYCAECVAEGHRWRRGAA